MVVGWKWLRLIKERLSLLRTGSFFSEGRHEPAENLLVENDPVNPEKGEITKPQQESPASARIEGVEEARCT